MLDIINGLSGDFNTIDLDSQSLEYDYSGVNGSLVGRYTNDCLQFEDGDVCIEASVLVLVSDNGFKDISVDVGDVYLCADELEVSEQHLKVLQIMIKKYLDFKF